MAPLSLGISQFHLSNGVLSHQAPELCLGFRVFSYEKLSISSWVKKGRQRSRTKKTFFYDHISPETKSGMAVDDSRRIWNEITFLFLFSLPLLSHCVILMGRRSFHNALHKTFFFLRCVHPAVSFLKSSLCELRGEDSFPNRENISNVQEREKSQQSIKKKNNRVFYTFLRLLRAENDEIIFSCTGERSSSTQYIIR